jgi:hypothetical protein
VSSEKWEPVRSSEGVQTYFRWIETKTGIKTRERKGEMIIGCTVGDATDILTDTRLSANWMTNIKESFEIKRLNPYEWYTYTLFHIPWPFENRDMVSYLTMKTNPENGNTSISIISKEEFIPCKSRITRLTDYIANWSIVRIDSYRIRITFTAVSGSPPAFPRWIQDPIIENMFHNNLINLKAYILLNKGRNSQISYQR